MWPSRKNEKCAVISDESGTVEFKEEVLFSMLGLVYAIFMLNRSSYEIMGYTHIYMALPFS